MSTETTVSQAVEQPAKVNWRRINLAAIRLDLIVGLFLVVQWLLFSVNAVVILLTEVLVLSFLCSWRFAVQDVSTRFAMHGALLGVMAVVFRFVFLLLLPGWDALDFILPSAMTILGSVAGGIYASRR